MSIVWDTALPQCWDRGWREKLPKTKLRTEMDAGPAKSRRRFTTGIGTITGTITLLKAQSPILITFHDEDLEGGDLPFEWIHPRDHSLRLYRFVEEPDIQDLNAQYERATLFLEMLPIVT